MTDKNPITRFLKRFIAGIRGIFGRNIASIAFTVLLVYMLVSAVFYMTSSHIESYQVTTGPLSMNETYTGLALREETVVKADSAGYITYYAREGDKINADGAVYALSAAREVQTDAKLSQSDLSKVREEMKSFSKSFSPSNFNNVYSFKYMLESSILRYAGVTGQVTTPKALTYEELEMAGTAGTTGATGGSGQSESVTFGSQVVCKALTDGIVLYSRDGYEGKTLENIRQEDFDQNSYHETDLKTTGTIKAGDDVYTIITDERWSLLIPLSDKQAVRLADRSSLRVRFLKDDMTQTGSFSIVKIDGLKYGKLDFNKGLIRYASDRFQEIELVTNNVTGLKIPLSSIVTKDFYTIPSTFATTDPDTGQEVFLVSERGSDGKSVTHPVTPVIYATFENPSKITAIGQEPEPPTYTYYVDLNSFKEGDAIVRKDSQAKFVVSEKAALEGVYCINQGYAVFRRIEILDQNEEYAIVSRYTDYGLVRYDHIVRNATRVKEQDILY